MFEDIKQTWLVVAAILGAVILISNFIKAFRELASEVRKPISELEEKLDSLSKKIDDIFESDILVKDALLSMQRKSLLDSCASYLKKGCASLEEKETISKQYMSYHDLGGDTFITEMVSAVNELPLEKKVKPRNKKEKEQ